VCVCVCVVFLCEIPCVPVRFSYICGLFNVSLFTLCIRLEFVSHLKHKASDMYFTGKFFRLL
jgi:hypothetical protein